MKRKCFYLYALFILVFMVFSCTNPFFIEKTNLYKITLNTNGGTPIKSFRTSFIESEPIPVKTDAVFIGWFTTADFSSPKIVFPLKIRSDLTLYAKWQQMYTVTFETNGGNIISSYKTTCINNSPVVYKEGCKFDGWYLTEDFSSSKITFPFDITEDFTLYAKWIIPYPVFFETNGGTQIKSIQTDYLENEPSSTKENKRLEGWYFDSNLTERVIFPLVIEKETVLYAKWEPIYCKITYYPNSADSGSVPQCISIEKGSYYYVNSNSENLKRIGYSFLGWITSLESTEIINIETPIKVESDINFYAAWRLNTYNISYELFDGLNSVTNPTSFTIVSNTINLSNPSKDNKVFGGWYNNSDFTGNKITTINSGSHDDIILYARWTEVPTIGNIIMSDGLYIQADDYAIYKGNLQPVAVYIGDNIKGEHLGVGLINSSSSKHNPTRMWASANTIGCKLFFEDIEIKTGPKIPTTGNYVNYPLEKPSYYMFGDFDGSDNWEYICEIDSEGANEPDYYYPVFNYALHYGETEYLNYTDYSSGWFIPSYYELCYIIKKNINQINISLSKVNGTPIQNGIFWSSSSAASATWCEDFSSSTINSSRERDYYVCCIRKFD